CFERGHTYLADGAAIAWIPPDLSLIGPDDLHRGKAIIDASAGELRGDVALATIMRARGHVIEASHWTLQYVGLRGTVQGRGLGTALVAPRLEAIDADGLPCGLTSSNPRNVSFYQRLGFEVVAEESTPDGEATLRPMARSAR
ncbi:MAG TPA: GNAT family N-acetyltransferase, partial [Nocardioidaceae bacterium]|nr:GNAT family N-acetyltransferase [Nocardioidaceae bacterium]